MPRHSRIIIGLNSGTSADGVDAVACEITGKGLEMRVKVIGHVSRSYPAELRRRILDVMAPAETRTEEMCRLETAVGEVFADAASAAMKRFGLKQVDAIGSHGQTICHLPPGAKKKARGKPRGGLSKSQEVGTLQIGDAAIIGQRTGVPVVSSFRQPDMAVGGQGAPLVPWTDYVLFGDRRRSRVIQNIGGIANLTWLPAGGKPSDVIAFDTGPGNMVIDALAQYFSKGRELFDKHGKRAGQGHVNAKLLHDLLSHPYLSTIPPKSCGREQFGQAWTRYLIERHERESISQDDWLATGTYFTAAAIALAYVMYLPLSRNGKRESVYPPMDEVILCGGGAKNPTLIRDLRSAVTFEGRFPVAFMTTGDFGISTQAKECVSFAMLAAACLDRVSANLPQVTGASRPAILGQIYYPS